MSMLVSYKKWCLASRPRTFIFQQWRSKGVAPRLRRSFLTALVPVGLADPLLETCPHTIDT